jgi:integrase
VKRRGFGYVRRLPSGKIQASYMGPDLARHVAPVTFITHGDAEAWLRQEEILRTDTDRWTPPAHRAEERRVRDALKVREYAQAWLEQRELRATTRDGYRTMLTLHVLPQLGDERLVDVSKKRVADWYRVTCTGRPRQRAKVYALLKTIMNTAVEDGLITENPVALSTAERQAKASASKQRRIEPATLDQLATITAEMPERLQLAVLLAAWGALRYGEVVELRRRDLDLGKGIVHVRRAVTWSVDGAHVGPPKTDAGIRDVHLPAFLVPLIEDHLARHAQPGPNGLLFPSRSGEHIWPATFWKVWRKAREAAGRPDLRFHDLRHTGAVMAAETGATLAELMARLGHTSARMAIRYQHAALNADQRIAEKLNLLATGGGVGAGPGDGGHVRE